MTIKVNKKLVNFRVSRDTIDRLDQICATCNVSRTSAMVNMIERYIVEQSDHLASKAAAYANLDKAIEHIRVSATRRARSDEPPGFLYDDGSTGEPWSNW